MAPCSPEARSTHHHGVMLTPRHGAAAAGLLVLATPVATWWVTGDLSEPIPDPDYMVRPIRLPEGVELAAGIGSVVLGLASIAVLARLFQTRSLDRKWLPPIVFLVVAGAIVGWGWRVLTAGVGGANIGGGMVMLFGGPLVVVLIVAAVVTAFFRPVRGSGG